jgi:hypothetical protein
LGLLSFGALPHPVAGEFPLLTAMLSVAGLVAGGMALVTRQKGAFATLLALMGILVSLFFPLFMLFLVLGWLNGLLVSH